MIKEKLDIIYEDKDIIIINKKPHLLTISTNNEKEKTLFHQVLLYLKKQNKNNKVFVVHRLDKETSGLIVFAKSEEIKRQLQNNWQEAKRGYVALVHGIIEKDKDTLKSYLKETKTLLVYETNKQDGKLAITSYQKVMNNKNYSLLNIAIKTGRKNQIRVQLANINHPIVGDKKYGYKSDPLRRLCLHANYLSFIHPRKKQPIEIKIDIPKSFTELCQ